MKGGGASAPVAAGLAVGVASVILFSFLSPGLALFYSKTLHAIESGQKASQEGGEATGKIVFAGTLDSETPQIYAVNIDGTGLTNLTSDDQWNMSPVASPDGSRVAYASSSNSPASPDQPDISIKVVSTDGRNKIQLTKANYSFGRFVWSPDGTKIAYEAGMERDGEIFVVSADGTGLPINVTNDKDSNDFNPVWTSDGKIIFESVKFDEGKRRFTESSFKEVDIRSGDVKKLFDFDYNTSGSHTWSPDLGMVAYLHKDNVLQSPSLYVMDAQGGGQTMLIKEVEFRGAPIWSPDGTKMVFNDGGESVQVSVSGPASRTLVSLSKSEPFDSVVAWSPDGKKIAFTRNLEEDGRGFAIYIMNAADGSDQRIAIESKYPIINNKPLDWLPRR